MLGMWEIKELINLTILSDRWDDPIYDSRDFRKKAVDKRIVSPLFDIFDRMEQQGFERRDGQVDMSLDIAEAFGLRKNIVVEAGVGIGKSFAYLFPSILYFNAIGRPIVIATSTIHLSNQLERDLRSACKILGIHVNGIVGKGQTHYYCEHRGQLAKGSNYSSKIKKYVDNFPNVENIKLNEKEWKAICVNKCLFNRCKFRHSCDFFNMRNNINGYGSRPGDIIIINQNLLIESYRKKNTTGKSLLNDFHEIVIIDEAHNLEDKARDVLTITLNKNEIFRCVEKVSKLTGNKYTRFFKIINAFFSNIISQIKNDSSINLEDYEEQRLPFKQSYLTSLNSLSLLLSNIYSEAQVSDVFKARKDSDELIEKLDNILMFFNNLKDLNNENYIFWIEINNRNINNGLTLKYAPSDIAKQLNHILFNQPNVQFVLTSATLSIDKNDKSYNYFKQSIGFHGESQEKQISPFPYDENARLYLPKTMLNHTDKDYIAALSKQIEYISNASEGRTLVLFTSKIELNQTFDMLSRNNNLNHKLIKQSEKAEEDTIKDFIEYHGVLLATGTYWEGLDIKGEALSSLIIVRLPYPVPDPIIQHKQEISNDKFKDVLFPEMMIKLKQGAGRLIRQNSDKGVLSILDDRLAQDSKYKYKHEIIDSLYINKVIYSISDIKNFLSIESGTQIVSAS